MSLADPQNKNVNLFVASTQVEYRGQLDEAQELVQLAWNLAQDHYDACIAAII